MRKVTVQGKGKVVQSHELIGSLINGEGMSHFGRYVALVEGKFGFSGQQKKFAIIGYQQIQGKKEIYEIKRYAIDTLEQAKAKYEDLKNVQFYHEEIKVPMEEININFE